MANNVMICPRLKPIAEPVAANSCCCGLGQRLSSSPGLPQRLIFRAKALMIGPQRLVTDATSLLVDDCLRDALSVVYRSMCG